MPIRLIDELRFLQGDNAAQAKDHPLDGVELFCQALEAVPRSTSLARDP